MVAMQNFPLDLVRISSNFFSSLISKGSVLFRFSRDVPGWGDPQAADGSWSSPSFQIFLHRLHRQVLRRGYTISLEQNGQFGIVMSSWHGDAWPVAQRHMTSFTWRDMSRYFVICFSLFIT